MAQVITNLFQGIQKNPYSYTLCDFLVVVQNGISFLFELAIVLAVIYFAWGGFLILTAGGSEDKVDSGRKAITAAAMGLVVVLSAYTIVNTAINAIGAGSALPWNNIQCKADIPETSPSTASSASCTDARQKELAQQNNEIYPAQNAPELTQLISCIQNKLPGENLGGIYTFDRSHVSCNYTRGNTTCDSVCSHAVNSCHYGGHGGSQGALAADFASIGVEGDRIIQAAMACGAKKGPPPGARCENEKGIPVACTSGDATHVHVNAGSCDAN